MNRALLALCLIFSVSFTVPCDARTSSSKQKQKIAQELANAVIDTLAPAPKDNESCFSPDEPCVAKLIKFMQTAKVSIDIAIFDITEKHIVNAIIDMSKKVKVRMVINKKLSHVSVPSFEMLKQAKVPMRVGRQKGIMHNKYAIVDGKRLELGSFNYTYGAANSNQENQLYLSTPGVVARYQERFEEMFRKGKTY